jgi:hypothetical protein
MCEDRIIRRFAGTFILIGAALSWWVHPAWLLFVAFVGANLLQSSFTAFCPLERILARVGAPGCRPATGSVTPVDRTARTGRVA